MHVHRYDRKYLLQVILTAIMKLPVDFIVSNNAPYNLWRYEKWSPSQFL